MTPPRLTTTPFPLTRFIPGSSASGPRPPHTPPLSPDWPADPAAWCESLDYLWGIDLFNAGFTWESHEALEVAWKQLKARAEREPENKAVFAACRAVQVIIQIAAARLKHEIGNAEGVKTILTRASGQVIMIAPPHHGRTVMGLDLNTWFDSAKEWFNRPTPEFPAIVLSEPPD